MPVAPARFLAIFDSLDYHVVIYDREWRYTYVNAEAARILGQPADALLGRSIWEMFPDAVGNQYHRELHDAVATGRAIHSEHHHAPDDRWFETHIYPLPDGVIVLARDVTEARAAAHAASEREHMLRLAQHAGGVATFVWDFANQQAQCSAEFFRIFGLPEQDGAMPAAEWAAFVHPDDRDRMAAHVARALRGEEAPVADYRIVRRDGRLRWLSYAGQLLRTAQGDRMLGTVADITARMEAEAALRHSRDVLSLAMRGGAMGAWSRDLATGSVWWSPELEEIVGLPPGSFSGTEAAFLDIVHEDDRDAVRQAVGSAVANRTDYIVDFRFRHASGEWRWMEGRGRAAYAADGSARSIYGIGIDVTVRKHDEAALQAAKEAAEAANRLKDQFLANLSHELRTPLNAILGYARLLQTGVIAPEKWRQAVAVIERNAVAQNQLVEDLLDMSRITTGTVHLDPAPVPLASIVRQAVDAVRPSAEAKGLAVALELDPFAGMVSADATRLQQVFWNLLNNAVKFTPVGGRIAVRLSRTGESVEAAITDTGIGIPGEFLPCVFEPFRQADARFGRRFGGLGLGLAICRQLVALHGGTITASSDGEGQGATFVVRLPACDLDAGAAADDEDRGAPAGDRMPAARQLAGVTVLLVEDDADTLTLFTTTLEAQGAQVRTAATPGEALAMVETWRPDLLVSDLGLPGMDGYELLRAIRAKTGPDELAAVAVSAYARPDDRARAVAAGFQAHVSKPVDPGDLVRALVATIATA